MSAPRRAPLPPPPEGLPLATLPAPELARLGIEHDPALLLPRKDRR